MVYLVWLVLSLVLRSLSIKKTLDEMEVYSGSIPLLMCARRIMSSVYACTLASVSSSTLVFPSANLTAYLFVFYLLFMLVSLQ